MKPKCEHCDCYRYDVRCCLCGALPLRLQLAIEEIQSGGPVGSNSAPAASLPNMSGQKENNTMAQSLYVGQVFSTSNSTVAAAQPGTLFEKLPNGQLQVRFVAPKPALTVKDLPEGTRIKTKYGAAEVVRLTSRSNIASLAGFNPSTQVLYVADVDSVVRFANAADVTKL